MSKLDLQTLVKQPAESRVYSMDFKANLDGASISTISSYTAAPAGLTLVGPALIAGTKIGQRISGGTAGVRYKIEIIITTSDGDTLEGEGYLSVVAL